MKKHILVLASLFTLLFSSVQAEVGINVGVTGSTGLFGASAFENEDGEVSREDDAMLAVGFASVFLEKTLGSRFAVGVDYIPSSIETEEKDETRTDMTAGANTNTSITQKIKVDFNDMTTFYVRLNVTDNLYVKAGQMTVDVNTKETLGTGSTYPVTSLDGTSFGLGYHHDLDSGIFVRAEGQYMNIDGVTLTSSNSHTITVSDIDGVTGTVSIGKSF
jgi:hypothetical protein